MNHKNQVQDFGIKILDALDNGDLTLIKEIVNNNERNLNEITLKERWNWLHKALLGFDKDKPPRNSIEYLISLGISVNAQDVYGMTPLHYAMRAKNAEAAIALLEAGADPNIPNRDNVIPLAMIGGMPERLDVLKLMLEKGGNPNYINANNDISIVKSLKKHVGNVDKFKPVIELLEKYS